MMGKKTTPQGQCAYCDEWSNPKTWEYPLICNDCMEGHPLDKLCVRMAGVMLDRKTEIAALQARIAELEAERRWIPVDERLPDESHAQHPSMPPHVIVACVDPTGRKYVTCRTYSTLNKGWVWYDPIVCWMPLPEPPEVTT